MEKILTDIVKEKGISKIIMDYKKQFDNITFCSCCNEKFENLFYNIKGIVYNNENLCFNCKVENLEMLPIETSYETFEKIFGTMKEYKMGRHPVWRRSKRYKPYDDYFMYIEDRLEDTDEE